VQPDCYMPVRDLTYISAPEAHRCSPEVLRSVARHGIVNPLIVVQQMANVVHTGCQRLYAAQLLGLEELPVVIARELPADLHRLHNAYVEVPD